MSLILFLRVLLLTLLAVPTLSSEVSSEGTIFMSCCFRDSCSNESFCADVNDTVVDCNRRFFVTDQCTLLRRCCYTDACSKENICAEDGLLRDSCGAVFDVATNCTLSRREGKTATPPKRCCFKDACSKENICAEDGLLRDSCGAVFDVATNCTLSRRENNDNDMNDASDGVIGQQTADPESSSSPSKPGATVTPPPEVPQTTPSTQSSFAENDSPGMNGTEGSEPCCYKDRCSQEDICAVDGVLRDSCDETFDVASDCSLTRRENDEDGMSTEPSQSLEIDDPISAQATPEAPSTTQVALPSSTPSPSVTGTTSEDDTATSITSEAVCIHIKHLSHLPSSALLYQRHVLSHVLCDSSSSCATPGHMIVYRGESMRMSRYCQIVGCQRERALVNSPRYSRGGRVDSHSVHLVFTVLAARFETRVEEIILAGLVRVGL